MKSSPGCEEPVGVAPETARPRLLPRISERLMLRAAFVWAALITLVSATLIWHPEMFVPWVPDTWMSAFLGWIPVFRAEWSFYVVTAQFAGMALLIAVAGIPRSRKGKWIFSA